MSAVPPTPWHKRPAIWITASATLLLLVSLAAAWPLFLRPRLALWHFHRAGDLYGQSLYADAIDSYRRSLSLIPGFAYSHYRIADCEWMLGHTGAALAEFDEAIRLDPTMDIAYCDRAALLRRLGRPQEALDTLDRLLLILPHARCHGQRAYLLMDLLRWEEAVVESQSSMDNRCMGDALLGLGRPLDAIVAYDRDIDCEHPDPGAFLRKGRALIVLERTQEARVAIERYLDGLDHDDPEARALLESLPVPTAEPPPSPEH